MEPRKSTSKTKNEPLDLPLHLQQQMALASQMGIPPGYMDPSLLAAVPGFVQPGMMDPQQMFNLQVAAAGGIPMVDPSIALQAFGSMGGIPPGGIPPGLMGGSMVAPGGAEWLAMMQQAQLFAAMGGTAVPGMPQMSGGNPFLNPSFNPTGIPPQKSRGESWDSNMGSKNYPSRSPQQGKSGGSRPSSTASSSRMTPSGISPSVSTSSRSKRQKYQPNPTLSSESVSKVISNQHEALEQKRVQTEQIMQAELMRQFEQQFLLQQLQLQQQQDQIQAALQALKNPTNLPGKSSQSEKIQQQLSRSIYEQLVSPNRGNSQPGTSSQQLPTLEMLMSLGQLPLPTVPSSENRKSTNQRPQSSNRNYTPPLSITSLSPPSVRPSSQSNERRSRDTPSSDSSKQRNHISGNSNPNDPNSSAFLAALYNSMQNPPETNLPKPPEKTVNPIPKSNMNLDPLANNAYVDGTKEISQHRRKQSNPMASMNFDVNLAAVIAKDVGSSEKPLKLYEDQLSLLKAEKSLSVKVKTENGDTSAFDLSVRKEIKKPDKSMVSDAEPETSSKIVDHPDVKNKELLAAMQLMASFKPDSKNGENVSRDITEESFKKILSGGQGGDLNKINDLLTATVAAEMHRLQVHQMNLQMELKMLGKNEGKVTQNHSSNKMHIENPAENKPGSSKVMNNHESLSDADFDNLRKHSVDDDFNKPINEGWKREIRIKYSGSQWHGDVVYVNRETMKLRCLADVSKYLEETGGQGLSINNFSFNPKLRIGTYYEQKDRSTRHWSRINGSEIESRVAMLDTNNVHKTSSNTLSRIFEVAKERRKAKSSRGSLLHNRTESVKRSIEERLCKEAEDRALKQAAELKDQQEKIQNKLLRQQERHQKLDQQRIEREIRERQLLEEKQKQEANRQLKYQEALQKAKEREIQRQQALIFKQQEREQRKQHLIFLKALDSKRRLEERDRRREEMRNEKIYIREKRMEQRRLANKLAKELKRPVEDMCLKNNKPLPILQPLQGTLKEKDTKRWSQLDGKATADVLMVLEFLHTFKDAILIDESVIPTFEQLQRSLLNDPEHTGSLVQLTMALLHQCLCDPGVPAPGPWLHCMTGMKVTDVDVSKGNYSEILRLFIWARNGFKCETSKILDTVPFLALKAEQKAEILAYLVNELVCSRPVCAEIEKHLENLATLRRDKWIVEGKIRQARIEHANDGSDTSTNSPMKQRLKIKVGNTEKDEDERDSVKGDNDSNPDGTESKPTCRSDTAIQRKMKELTKEHQSFNELLFTSSKPLRGLDLGQDRYRRRYWALSNLGGVYVESLESGRFIDGDDDDDVKEDETKDGEKCEENMEVISQTKSSNQDSQNENVVTDKPTESNLETICENKTDEIYQNKQNSVTIEEKEMFENSSKNENERHKTENTEQSEHLIQPTLPVEECEQKNKVVVEQEIEPTQELFNDVLKPEINEMKDSKFDVTNTKSPTSIETNSNNDVITSTTDQHTTISTFGLNQVNQPINNNESTVPQLAQQSSSNEAISTLYKQPTNPDTGSPMQENSHYDMINTKAEPHVIEQAIATTNVENNKRFPEPGNPVVETEDSVLAAAKAIAAKAVASSSHLLFPRSKENMSQSNYQSKPLVKDELKTETQNTNQDVGCKENELGEHTAKALLSMGINPTSLSQKQLEALSHNRDENTDKKVNETQVNEDIKKNPEKPPTVPKSEISSQENEAEPANRENKEEELPMDLSKPMPTKINYQTKQPVTNAFIPPLPFNITGKPTPSQITEMSNFFIHGMNYPLNLLERSLTPKSDEMKTEFMIPPGAMDHVIPSQDIREEPLPIPKETKYGWWRITEEQEFDSMVDALHPRGTREKYLHRMAVKHRKFCIESMEVSTKSEFCFANGPKQASTSGGESKENGDSVNGDVEKDDGVQKDIKEDDTVVLEENDDITEDILENPVETAFQIEMETLKQVEELSDRCVAVGVLNMAWSSVPKASFTRKDLAHIPYVPNGDAMKHDATNPVEHDPESVLCVTVDLLRKLELAIPRSYLKPPLVRKGGATEFSNLPSLSESGATDVAAGLRTWRNAVSMATSAAQIAMCVTMLETCIAWERTPRGSIKTEMSPKVKKKRSDKRSAAKAQLPSNSMPGSKKKRKSPEFTSDIGSEIGGCNSDVTVDANVILREKQPPVSPKQKRKRSLNEFDSILDDAHDGENSYPCSDVEGEVSRNGINDSDRAGGSGDGSIDGQSENCDVVKKKKKKAKKKAKDEGDKDKKKKRKHTAACREILRKLQAHEMATWFLFPVDPKVVPNYRKVIKKPIDFSTIENRLKKGRYKTAEGFMNEILMVFDNCRLFNEDDSPIGRAGHALRSYFDERWAELVRDNVDFESEV
ncbi:bromodomain adjacent to zinc finger domain protein 2A isoform X1 [Ciona intestinalis]